MANFLDKTGLSYFWDKVKSWADARFLKLTGGTITGDLTISKDESPTLTFRDADSNKEVTLNYQYSSEDGIGMVLLTDDSIETGGAVLQLHSVILSDYKASTPFGSTPSSVVSKYYVDHKISDEIDTTVDAMINMFNTNRKNVILSASGWSNNSQTVTVEGVENNEQYQLIRPIPATSSQLAYINAGIICTEQAANSLTFTCEEVPTEDLTVYILISGVTD